mmetsp:Transcript_10679/g.24303  ORF Transcript_10679/g.24303 Transcript_10679/m.24303 type:complete len:409 (-) Transcript_10679:9-1235(-)
MLRGSHRLRAAWPRRAVLCLALHRSSAMQSSCASALATDECSAVPGLEAAKEQDFARGWPHPSIISMPSLQEALTSSFADMIAHSEDFLNYGGKRSYKYGQSDFLLALAEFLSKQYGREVDSSTLMSTAGISMGMDIAARSLTNPGDIVVCEGPTYYLAHQIFLDNRLTLMEVPMEADGLDLKALRRICTEHPSKVKLVYTVPVHHNPTGVTLSTAKRQELLDMAAEFDFRIIADEAYQLLNFEPTGAVPLFYNDSATTPRVLSIGSFSKLIGPGLKVGWIQAHPDLLKELITRAGWLTSGSNPVIFTSGILISFLRSGDLARHIERVSMVLAEKCSHLVQELEKIGLEPNHPKGGYFVWLRVKGKRTGRSGKGMSLQPSDAFADFMRLSFAWLTKEQISEGIRYLAE